MCEEALRLDYAKSNINAWKEIRNKYSQKTKIIMPSWSNN